MYNRIKQEAYDANMELPKLGLVLFTFGNVSVVDRENKVFAIKPSGVPYEDLKPSDMVIVDFDSNIIEGDLRPSSDTKTHAVLYKEWEGIGSIVHTHSTYGTAWAQSNRDIPIYGTTHADYIYGEVPCLRTLTKEEIDEGYEKNTGILIADYFRNTENIFAVPCALCKNHGPFAWGKDAMDAVHNAVVLEEVAKMAARTEMINPHVQSAPQILQDKHYLRKHGPGAYYGQK